MYERPINWTETFQILSLDATQPFLRFLGINPRFGPIIRNQARSFLTESGQLNLVANDSNPGASRSQNQDEVAERANMVVSGFEALGGSELVQAVKTLAQVVTRPPRDFENEDDWSVLFHVLVNEVELSELPFTPSQSGALVALIMQEMPSDREKEALGDLDARFARGAASGWDLTVNASLDLESTTVIDLMSIHLMRLSVRRVLGEINLSLTPDEREEFLGWAHSKQRMSPLRFGDQAVSLQPG